MNFKHTGSSRSRPRTGTSPWSRSARRGGPIRVLNLFAYTGGATLACAQAGASVCHVDAAKGMVAWAQENARCSGLCRTRPSAGSLTTARSSSSGRSAAARRYDAIIMDPPSYGRGPGRRDLEARGGPLSLREARRRGAVGSAPVRHSQRLYNRPRPVRAGLHPAAARRQKVRRRVTWMSWACLAPIRAWRCPAARRAAGVQINHPFIQKDSQCRQ